MAVDTVGDFLTVIRNGILVSKKSVVVPYSKLRNQIAQIFKDEGFIKDIAIEKNQSGHDQLKLFLKYVGGESVIHDIKRISKPGRRIYRGLSHIEPVIGGLGISILTTNQGIITNKKAKELGVGGEVLCTIW